MTLAGFLVMMMAGRPGTEAPTTVLWLDCGVAASRAEAGEPDAACRIRSFAITTAGAAEVTGWTDSSTGRRLSDDALLSKLAGLVRP